MTSLYRVWRAMAKPIKCIALGNPEGTKRGAGSNTRPITQVAANKAHLLFAGFLLRAVAGFHA